MVKVGVVIPVMSQFELAIKALESITVTNRYAWQAIIINNWDSNNGVAHAWNLGAKSAIDCGANYILIINDDIILAPHTVDHLIKLLSENPDIGVVTATDYRDSISPAEVKVMDNPNYEIEFLDAPNFACFMLTPAMYNYIGRFDENFSPAYFEDNDYCYRTILSGHRCVRSQNAAFYHYGSRTQNSGDPVVPSPVFERNRDYYVNKWGGLPDRETRTKPWNNENLDWTAVNPI